jgi:hypothetical protein
MYACRTAAPLLLVLTACEARPGAPEIFTIAPSTTVEGQAIDVVITGRRFAQSAAADFREGSVDVEASFVASLSGVSLELVQRLDARTLTARVPVTLAPGLHTLVVIAPSGTSATLAEAFTVTAAPVRCPGHSWCDDGDPCNGEERCNDGVCAPGTALDCADADPCTTDERCEEGIGCFSTLLPTLTWYRDADGDGFGDLSVTTEACVEPAGFVEDGHDCDDDLGGCGAGCFPDNAAADLCDGFDQDCDDVADDDCLTCADGLDNDGDSAIDFPNDPGCDSATDPSENNIVPPEDCAGDVPLAVPANGLISGATNGTGDDYAGTCGGGQAPEVVYEVALTAPVEELLVATDRPGTNFDTLIHLRDTCDDGGTELACDDDSGNGNRSMLHVGPLAAGRYFLFIGGHDNSRGEYEARLQAIVAAGAACSGSSGFYRCAPEHGCLPAPNGITTCQPVGCDAAATYTSSFTATGDTTGLLNVHAGTCGQGTDGGRRAPEVVYRLDLASAVSNVNVSTINPGTTYDTLIYMRAGCGGAEVGCVDDTSGVQSMFDTGALAAGTYFIFVDGFADLFGAYEVTVTVSP